MVLHPIFNVFLLMEHKPHDIIISKHIFHILGVAIRGLHAQSHILDHLFIHLMKTHAFTLVTMNKAGVEKMNCRAMDSCFTTE
jgi:hypothetical protein